MAGACGMVYGWQHTWTQTYLRTVYNLANPDGGWGLSEPYDAFGDGTLNPASTTYTVTVADHVGPVLLAGFKAGAVPWAKVQSVVDLLMSTPRIPVERGQCIAYSRAEADARPGYEVHNVSAGAAWFLHECAAAGFGATGLHRLVTDVTVHQVQAYRPEATWWPYIADGPNQDADHNAYSAEAMYRLAYWVGREVVYHHLTTAYSDNACAPVAHMRLVSLPALGPATMSRTQPGVTLWAELGDRWLPEIDAWIAAPPSPTGMRLAQAAYFCGRNAVNT
jgi:hypothetical protein